MPPDRLLGRPPLPRRARRRPPPARNAVGVAEHAGEPLSLRSLTGLMTILAVGRGLLDESSGPRNARLFTCLNTSVAVPDE